MTTDFYNLLLSDCALAVLLLVLFWYVQRNSRGIWADTLRAMGPAYAPLANFPEDPSLN